ncbi:MAG: flagellar type III secretion system protein FliR [Alphaproteobacteria bacterium]|nr:flagellar type III secretion system protein FliR [Alphaproteobacteria bacterium]
MLERLLALEVFSYLLVFSRLGAAIMLLPGFGEAFVPLRVRLLAALTVTAVMYPVVAPLLPDTPTAFVAVLLLILGEVTVGVFIGTVARVLTSALSTTGTIIAFLTGFANAILFNPAIRDQGAMTSVLLSLLGILLILVTDLHHLMFAALMDSYTMFVPGSGLPFDDFSEAIGRLVAGSFLLGVQLAAPFIIVVLLFYICLGILARLMPQFQVFFVGLPLQIMLGLTVLVVSISAIMMLFLDYFATGISGFITSR